MMQAVPNSATTRRSVGGCGSQVVASVWSSPRSVRLCRKARLFRTDNTTKHYPNALCTDALAIIRADASNAVVCVCFATCCGLPADFAFLFSRAPATSPVALASKGRHCLTVPLATLLLLCGVSAGGAPVQVSVRDVAGAAVPDAVVHANPIADTVAGTRPRRNAVIEQIGREFVPQVTVVQAGTTVAFQTVIACSITSIRSPAKTFEIKLYSGAAPFDVLFDKAGLVNHRPQYSRLDDRLCVRGGHAVLWSQR